jgi:hypothetical protein
MSRKGSNWPSLSTESGIPLRRAQINARRVVAAGVQQNHALCRQLLDGGQHFIKQQAAADCIIVRIVMYLDASTFKDGAVVVPAGVADPGFTLWK